MNILILYFEPSIRQILQFILELEGYTVLVARSAAEAVETIECSEDSFLLIADNYQVNQEARQAFMMLHERPELRNRVTIVGMAVFEDAASALKADGLMDDHLRMSFTPDQLLSFVELHAGRPPC